MTTIAFYNSVQVENSASLVLNLGHRMAELGRSVLLVDLDPQAGLTSMVFDQGALEQIWLTEDGADTIMGQVRAVLDQDNHEAMLEIVGHNVLLLAGNPALASLEPLLAEAWVDCLAGEKSATQRVMVLEHAIGRAAARSNADVVLLHLGSDLGAITRSALMASNGVVVPVTPDPFTLRALRSFGPVLRRWRMDWARLSQPGDVLQPLGYVVLQDSVRASFPTGVIQHWKALLPLEYRRALVDDPGEPEAVPEISADPWHLATLKTLRSLTPLAEAARKPIFDLRPADGAIGAYGQAVRLAEEEFGRLAQILLERSGVKALVQ